MVNKLSGLAEFLDSDSLPSWLKAELRAKRDEIFGALERGEGFSILGPDGQTVKIAPKPVAAA